LTRPEFAFAALALLFALAFTCGVVMLFIGVLGRPRRLPRRAEIVGRTCTIRSFLVDEVHGQARLRGGAVIPVRSSENSMFMGDTALVSDYDADGRFFWVTPFSADLDPERRGHR
jgi:hypothetical protein